uniref:Secreted protein n=1 Tax=Macrostomum lignano TaxID=282301 RepID=A0A1I8FRU9_9PLAT
MTCLRQADQWPLLSLSRLHLIKRALPASCQQSQSNNNRKEPLRNRNFLTKFLLQKSYHSSSNSSSSSCHKCRLPSRQNLWRESIRKQRRRPPRCP